MAPPIQWLGALLLLWLHLCGCSGNSDEERISYFEFTASPHAHGALPLEQTAPPPAKRRPTRAHGTTVGGDVVRNNRIPFSKDGDQKTTTPGGRGPRRTVTKDKNVVFPKSAIVCAGEDVIFRMLGAKGHLVQCTVVTAKKTTVTLFPPAPNNDGQHGNKSRIAYYDSGEDGERCGMRIRGAVMDHYGTWTMTAVTDEVNITSGFGLTVTNCTGNGYDSHYELLPGEKAASQCGPPGEVKACYVEPPGDSDARGPPAAIQVGSCYTPAANFSNLVAGEWSCQWTRAGSILPRESKAEIEYAELPSDVDVGLSWRNTSSPSGSRNPSLDLRCNYLPLGILNLCKLVKPGGGDLYPSDGLASGRYSYFGRGLLEGDCGISVEQPLRPEDIGVWRCEAYTSDSEWRGGFLEVGIGKRTREEKAKTLRAWRPRMRTNGNATAGDAAALEVMSGDPLIIGCSVEAPLTLCLIRRPDGNASAPPRVKGDSSPIQAYGRGERLGDCGIRVRSANGSEHSGLWECVVGIDYGDAVAVPIRVNVHERPLVAEVPVDVSRGLPAKFRCRSVLGVALEHCRFERPDHSIVTVMDSRHPDVESASWRHGVRAVGDLGAGVCAVSIPSVREEDVGEWTCVAKAQDSMEDVQVKFLVVEQGISAASVGVISALVVVLAAGAAAGGVVIHRRRRRGGTPGGVAANQGEGRDDSVISFRRGDDEDASSNAS